MVRKAITTSARCSLGRSSRNRTHSFRMAASSSVRQPHKDTWIDGSLDWLRDHTLSPAVEVLCAWLVVTPVCFASYVVSWMRTVSSTSVITSIPLMTYYDPSGEADDGREEKLIERMGRIATDAELVHLVRQDAELRRQVSQFMMSAGAAQKSVCDGDGDRALKLRHRLAAVWSDLLQLPTLRLDPPAGSEYKISLIIPAYKEAQTVVADTLSCALHRCCHPQHVQVIVVISPTSHICFEGHGGWGALDTVVYDGNGGRGPCHNAGARHAAGQILTFLHADTIMAPNWDVRVQAALLQPRARGRIQACAFTFGHNVESGKPYPWGIRAVQLLGNMRSYFLGLPYGDHIISIPSDIFRYLGGFPHKPIMEDYVLMDLLRQRAHVLRNGERIAILPPPGGQCSARRWRQLGVVYVTLVNALMVHRYVHGGWSAHDVFDYYYQRPCAKKKR